jgi:hypothetical protein
MIKRILIALTPLLVMNSTLPAQDFLPGINMYNRAAYDSIIYVYGPQFLASHPHEEGLARYFIGESYYNKALAEGDITRCREFFDKAWSEFEKTKRSSLPANLQEYHSAAQYKSGWCSYRLAELTERNNELLARAEGEFLGIDAAAEDSLRLFSYFMAAECRIRQSILGSSQMIDKDTAANELNRMIAAFSDVRRWLGEVIEAQPTMSAPRNLANLQAASRLRLETLKFHIARLYMIMPGESFPELNDPQKQADARLTALARFNSLQYDSLSFDSPAPGFRDAISYLNLVKQFNLHLLSRDAASQNRFLSALEKLRDPEHAIEGRFRLAGVYHSLPEKEESNFNRMALSLFDSASGISEADYWMANIYMIENDVERSRQHFTEFIDSMAEAFVLSVRQHFLLEDAQVKKYLLDFETFYLSNQTSELRSLEAQIEAFTPQSEPLRQRFERVKLLTHLAFSDNVGSLWSNVLTGSDEEKLRQTLDAIMFVLSRAALNIGATREKYIPLLNPLFEIMQPRRPDETRFFKGIVRTLEAEIQARPTEKIENYKAAAALLGGINRDFEFKDEADYVRGICLFYAEEFDEARAIFLSLINQQRYLRALFYLAEIFRYTGEGMAARECYQAIVEKLKDSRDSFSEYWFVNALAGIASADDSGDRSSLPGINFQQIEFLPPLKDGALIFERLADESFLKQQLTSESIDLLARFGLPQREIYPSHHLLKNSVFVSENIFRNLPPLVDEVRGPLSTVLALTAILPGNASGPPEVYLNGESLSRTDEIFYRSDIPLNSEFVIEIRHPQCYGLRRLHRFSKPGEDRQVFVLTKQIDFSHTNALKRVERPEDAAFLPSNDNLVLNTFSLRRESGVAEDFRLLYELRDLAFDRMADRFLAVNAERNNVWLYANDGMANRSGIFETNLNDSLNSPEGIAVDSRGNVFIADWGRHRIVKLDNAGTQVAVIGSFGSNGVDTLNQAIKLTFPTRVAILEDLDGVVVGDQKYFKESYLFIADYNGIHISNLQGEYLDTALSPNAYFDEGDFYGLAVARELDRLQLRVVNRSERYRGQIFEYVEN